MSAPNVGADVIEIVLRDLGIGEGRLFLEREARDTEALFGFVKANQATHSVRVMCRLLKVSKSGFYAWDRRGMSARERADVELTVRIRAIHHRSRDTYGSPNIHAELADDHGIHVGRKRVARLMRAAGLRGATLRKFVVTTVLYSHDYAL